MRWAGRGARQEPQHAAASPQALVVVGAPSSPPGVVDEQHVEVAGVGQLAARRTGPAATTANGTCGSSCAERRLDARPRPGRSGRAPTVATSACAEHVAGGHAQQVAAAPAPQRPLPVVEVGPPRQRAGWPTPTSASRSSVCSRSGSASRGDQVGVGAEDVAQQRARCPAARTGAGRRRGCRGRRAPAPIARWSPVASLRRPSSPRSGSGDADSQSSSSGRSCCIIRDDRVRPRVSSRTAARVRSASVNPKLASAPGRRLGRQPAGPGQGVEQRAEVEALVDGRARGCGGGPGRGRTPRWARRRACPGSRAPGPRGAAGRGRAGTVWVCCSSSSCRACSTRRRNR